MRKFTLLKDEKTKEAQMVEDAEGQYVLYSDVQHIFPTIIRQLNAILAYVEGLYGEPPA